MATRELTGVPRILPLYARALAPMLPGASHLPHLAGGGGAIPDLELTLAGARVDLKHLAEYDQVCSFPGHAALPATYPHVLAFPLQLALITDRHFPLAPVGLVHLANRITQHRPIRREERLDLGVHATPLADHRSGQTFMLVSEARVAGELVWRELSTMLRRERRAGASVVRDERSQAPAAQPAAEWRLPRDLGRRYATVSGDRNPIHLHALSAKMFGFPRAIAHGMWTMARCVAAIEHRLPEVFSIDVRFRAPILLPGTVAYSKTVADERIHFSVTDPSGERRHLDGWAHPGVDGAPQQEEAR
jgi:acyl dehydratase